MTYEEAIERLKYKVKNCDGCGRREDDITAFGMAMKAIKKQIPKFVLCPNGFLGDRYTRYLCPNCGKNTRQRESYCHKCGQAVKYPKEIYDRENNRIVLDWSEKE